MHTKIRRRSLGLLALAVVPLALGACSSTSEQVKDQIATQVKDKLNLAEEPTVTCPDDAKAKEGETFTCDMELEGKTVPVKVTFKDDTHFESSVVGAVYKKSVIDDGLAKQLSDNNVDVKSVDCPGTKLVVIPKGKTIDCAAVDNDGQKATLIVGLNDQDEAQIQDIKTD
ncbi:MAG: DUF4333 domain-containing protein [Acidimicrobiales bacterium]